MSNFYIDSIKTKQINYISEDIPLYIIQNFGRGGVWNVPIDITDSFTATGTGVTIPTAKNPSWALRPGGSASTAYSLLWRVLQRFARNNSPHGIDLQRPTWLIYGGTMFLRQDATFRMQLGSFENSNTSVGNLPITNSGIGIIFQNGEARIEAVKYVNPNYIRTLSDPFYTFTYNSGQTYFEIDLKVRSSGTGDIDVWVNNVHAKKFTGIGPTIGTSSEVAALRLSIDAPTPNDGTAIQITSQQLTVIVE